LSAIKSDSGKKDVFLVNVSICLTLHTHPLVYIVRIFYIAQCVHV